MVEPRLLVDIYPDSTPDEFQSRHGLTIEHMTELAIAGYIIPNIYYYKNDGLKKYIPLTHLHPLLKIAKIN